MSAPHVSAVLKSPERAKCYAGARARDPIEMALQNTRESCSETGVIQTHRSQVKDLEDGVPAKPQTWRVLLMIGAAWLGVFLTALDSTIMATILGPISTYFSSFNNASWLATAFLIATAVTQPLAGRLTDVYGRRKGLVLSNATFALGNLICGLAKSEAVLLLGRTVAGLGGGGIYAISTVMGSDLIPLRQRGIALGANNILYGVGLSLGGFLGGWITDAIGWQWVFLLQVPLSAITTVLVFLTVKIPMKRKPGDQKRIDYLGSSLLVTGLVLLLVGLNAGGNIVGWTSPLVLATIPLGFILLGSFVWWESLAVAPIIPTSLLVHQPTVVVSCSSYLLTHMAFFAILYYIPLYLQILDYTSLQAGVRLISLSCGLAVGAVTAGIVTRTTGRYLSINFVAHLALLIAFSLYATLDLDPPKWHTYTFLAIGGFGFGSTLVINLVALVSAVDHEHASSVTAMAFVFRSVGSTLGITFTSVLFQNTFRARLQACLGSYDEDTKEAIFTEVAARIDSIGRLASTIQPSVRAAYVGSLHDCFLLTLGFTIAGAAVSMLMKQHVLHKRIERD